MSAADDRKWLRIAPIALGAVVLGAGALSLIRSSSTPPEEPAKQAVSAQAESSRPQAAALPPATAAPPPTMGQGSNPAPGGEPSAITWKVPETWQTLANSSPMRIATYRPPPASGSEEAEMSVSRAGGSTDANIERWRGQFEGSSQEKRAEKSVRGLKVTVVELGGTYLGGNMMPGAPSTPHKGWALLAAIVETPGSAYFFKLVGPATSVHGARAGFDALIESIAPNSG
jgi:hypothetical protein